MNVIIWIKMEKTASTRSSSYKNIYNKIIKKLNLGAYTMGCFIYI